MTPEELVYDWNTIEPSFAKPNRHIGIDDETLRDGLQSPSVTNPAIEAKFSMLDLMEELGINVANIGLPGAGGKSFQGKFFQETLRLAQYVAQRKYSLKVNCAARTLNQDCEAVVEIAQRSGLPIEGCLFLGSSPIRKYVEGWTIASMIEREVQVPRERKLVAAVIYNRLKAGQPLGIDATIPSTIARAIAAVLPNIDS